MKQQITGSLMVKIQVFVLLVNKVLKESKEFKVHKEKLVHKVHKVKLVHKEKKVTQVLHSLMICLLKNNLNHLKVLRVILD